MPQALLIAGNARRFDDDIRTVDYYLKTSAGVTRKKIRDYRVAYLDEELVETRLQMALEQRTKEPLLIMYSGHGGGLGWGFDDVRTFYYSTLAGLLTKGKRPVLILNNCCHAMAAVQCFEEKGVSKKRVSFAACSDATEVTTSNIINLAISSWRSSRPLRLSQELRWGAQHDHLFFPKALGQTG